MKKIFIVIFFEIILIILLHRCLISPHFSLYELHDIINIKNKVGLLQIDEPNHTFSEEELKLVKDILNRTEELKNIDFVIENTGKMFVNPYWLKDGVVRLNLYIEKKYYGLLESYISKSSDFKTIKNNKIAINIYYPGYDKDRKDYMKLELFTRIPSYYNPEYFKQGYYNLNLIIENKLQQYILNLNETKRLKMLEEYYTLVKELSLYFLIFNIFTFLELQIIKKAQNEY